MKYALEGILWYHFVMIQKKMADIEDVDHAFVHFIGQIR